jgi:hypothetical protein
LRGAAIASFLAVSSPAAPQQQAEDEAASPAATETAAVKADSSVQDPAYPKKLENVHSASAGQTLVIGSIHYAKKGKPADCGGLLAKCELFILPPTGRKPITYSFSQSGEFAWSLPPGDYTMLALSRADDMQGVRLAFSVRADASAVYIGDLVFMIFSGMLVTGSVDAFEKVQAEFASKFAGVEPPLVKSLAGGDDSLGTSSKIIDICDAEWGLECKPRRRGLAPILPNKGKGVPRFLVADLRPQFSWAPSTQEGVTYDLAIYESARFGGLFKRHIRGRLVQYVENLTEPQWKPEEDFEPGHQYYWSIRLRKGETVSSWSTYSYSFMAGLGMATVYRAWLRFNTPAER